VRGIPCKRKALPIFTVAVSPLALKYQLKVGERGIYLSVYEALRLIFAAADLIVKFADYLNKRK
jgi:hypothetical protein